MSGVSWGKKLSVFLVLVAILGLFAYLVHSTYMISYIKTSSMEPTYNRGDLVIIRRVDPREISIGDVIVFRSPEENVLILHRVVAIRESDGKRYFLTKGDNPSTNPYVDPWGWVDEDRVVGVLVARIPYVGFIFLMFDELGARFLLVLVGILLVLVYAMESAGKAINLSPLFNYVRSKRVLLVYVVFFLLAISQLYIARLAGKNFWSVSILSKDLSKTVRNEYYVVLKLNVTSKINGMESIQKIEIYVKIGEEVLGFGVWKIAYPFYGIKIVSIAILLSRPIVNMQNTNIVMRISVYDYARGVAHHYTVD